MYVKVADARPGIGKTSAAINMINNAPVSERFLFVTPFLSEGKRVIAACPDREFQEPDDTDCTKLMSLKVLLRERTNIVTTHELFRRFDDEVIEILTNANYTLIIDEAPCLIDTCDITSKDYDILMNGLAEVVDDDNVVWRDDDYEGKLNEYKSMCELGALKSVGNKKLLWMMPKEAFYCFDEVYIMTYMFEAQLARCYMDLQHIEWQKVYVAGDSLSTWHFVDTHVDYAIPAYDKLIHILDNEKMNSIGDKRTALSKNWFVHASSNTINDLKKNISNYYKNICHAKASENLWTTFKDFRYDIAGKGYTGGFLSCNARATNEFRSRKYLAYIINKFPSPELFQFFEKYGVHLDSDAFAVSELVQWIWRSAIRDNRPIQLYIPSKRMRTLFQEWIRNVCGGGDNQEHKTEVCIQDTYRQIQAEEVES